MINRAIAIYKISFTGLSSKTWLLSCIMLINRSGTMVMPFMTLYLTGKTMQRSLSDAGIVIGLFGLGSVVGAYFGGKLTDKIGFHKVQFMSLFLGGIFFITLGQIKTFPLICCCTFLLSMVNDAFRPANASAIAHYSSPENRTRSYSLNRLAVNLGWSIGASIGGFLASYNYELLFWVDGITNICAAVVLFNFLKPVKKNESVATSETAKIIPEQSAYKDKKYLKFILLCTLFTLCFIQLFSTIPKYFRDNLNLNEKFIGLIMALNGLIIVLIEMVLVYHLEGKRKNLVYVSYGLVISALAFFCLLLPGPAKLISLAMILFITLGEIISMPFMNSYWISCCNEKNRGQYAALFTISFGTAQTLGPFLASILVDATSFNILFITMIGVLFFTAIGFYRLSKD